MHKYCLHTVQNPVILRLFRPSVILTAAIQQISHSFQLWLLPTQPLLCSESLPLHTSSSSRSRATLPVRLVIILTAVICQLLKSTRIIIAHLVTLIRQSVHFLKVTILRHLLIISRHCPILASLSVSYFTFTLSFTQRLSGSRRITGDSPKSWIGYKRQLKELYSHQQSLKPDV